MQQLTRSVRCLRAFRPGSFALIAAALPVPVRAQQLFEFEQTADILPSVMTLAAADFDLDGRIDCAVAPYAQGVGGTPTVTLRLNAGDADLVAGPTFTFPGVGYYVDVETADLNEDGDTDLAVGYSGTIGLVLSDGNGGFLPELAIQSGEAPTDVDAVDMNGDGHLDLVAPGGDSDFSIHFGDGLGGFSAPQVVPLTWIADALALVVGDYDTDGFLDVALATGFAGSPTTSNVFIVFGQPGGTFTSPPVVVGILGNVSDIEAADFDFDGRTDLVVPSRAKSGWVPGTLAVLFGNSTRTPSAPVYSPLGILPRRATLADLDRDGKVDVLVSCVDELMVFFGTGLSGSATFDVPIRYGEGMSTSDAVVEDFDGNTFPDVCMFGSGGRITVLRGDDLGLLRAPTATFVAGVDDDVELGDLNGDGELDAVVATGTSSGATRGLTVFLGTGSGSWAGGGHFSLAAGDAPERVTLGDLNNDGKLDAAVSLELGSSHENSLALFLGDGLGGFGAPQLLLAGDPCVELRIADLDGDGVNDLVAGSDEARAVYSWRGTGGGAFTTSVHFPIFKHIPSFDLADLDHDGQLDLVSGSDPDWNFVILRGGGAANFQFWQFPAGRNHSVRLGDLNGDGELDLVGVLPQTQQGPERLEVRLGNGAGGFGAPTPYLSHELRSIELGDLDGDGHLDVAAHGGMSVAVYLGSASGALTGPEYHLGCGDTVLASTGGGGLALGDIDGDAKLDLVVLGSSGETDASLGVLRNQDGGCASTSYCVGKVNSEGCVPTISSAGCSSASATTGFNVHCTNVVNNKTGRLFYSVTGPNAVPFQGGTLCIKAPLLRTPQMSSGGSIPPTTDCSGSYAIDFNAFAAGGTGNPALQIPGTTVYVQWWGRDPAHADAFKVQLSNALSFVIHS